jgi:trans-aconitate 3-methyltransferase
MATKDPTFRVYDPDQAALFARQRKSYSSTLYEVIISYHVANGGRFHSLLDVGCGSGSATRGLANYIDLATGIDPGRELALQAKYIGGQTRAGNTIQYEICSAEEACPSELIEKGSVDLLSVGMAVRFSRLS